MLLLKITESGVTPRKLRPIVRQMQITMFGKLGAYWHRYFRPKHFTAAGAAEYGYTPRTQKYTRRKLRTFNHANPLVYSGESRELARMKDIRATSKGVKIVMPAVRKLNFTPKGGRIKMADELRTISAGEQKQLEDMGTREMARRAPL
jgi:hypothetical protein